MKIKPIAGTLCLLTGMSIYMLFGSRQLLGFGVADGLGLNVVVDPLRRGMAHVRVPYFVRFCLPDALWATAYILIMDTVFCQSSRQARWIWAAAIPVVGAFSEGLQLVKIIPGTFDVLDLPCYLLPLTAYTFIIHKTPKQYELRHQQPEKHRDGLGHHRHLHRKCPAHHLHSHG